MKYEYQVQGDYGYGFETLVTEETLPDAMLMLQCYNNNEPHSRHRIQQIPLNEQ